MFSTQVCGFTVFFYLTPGLYLAVVGYIVIINRHWTDVNCYPDLRSRSSDDSGGPRVENILSCTSRRAHTIKNNENNNKLCSYA